MPVSRRESDRLGLGAQHASARGYSWASIARCEVRRHGSFGPAYFATVGIELTAAESFSKFAGPAGDVIRFFVPDIRLAGRRARNRKG
jgi:hypothetical protein